jgi:uncharacterized protein YqjF (DUF2071 family)
MTGAHAWRSLLFVHWEIAAQDLRPLVAPGLDIDTFEGKAYVGLVPFTMPMVKPLARFPGSFAFHETNVRTYVRRNGTAGVWFFSLDAASSIAVRAARWLFHLPYFRASMTLAIQPLPHSSQPLPHSSQPLPHSSQPLPHSIDGADVRYHSERRWPQPTPARCDIHCRAGAPLGTAAAGTLAHFLVERYALFAATPAGKLVRADVHHAPYPLRGADIVSLDETLIAAAGVRRPDQFIETVLYSDGVDVTVTGPTPA